MHVTAFLGLARIDEFLERRQAALDFIDQRFERLYCAGLQLEAVMWLVAGKTDHGAQLIKLLLDVLEGVGAFWMREAREAERDRQFIEIADRGDMRVRLADALAGQHRRIAGVAALGVNFYFGHRVPRSRISFLRRLPPSAGIPSASRGKRASPPSASIFCGPRSRRSTGRRNRFSAARNAGRKFWSLNIRR